MLKGDNITLRPLKQSDWEKTIQWRNNLETKQLAMMHPYPVTEFLEKEWYEELLKTKSNKVVYFAIADENDSPVGYIFLNNINQVNRNCYLGIIIGNTNQRGKGYGTKAIELLLEYAFSTLNLNKVTVEVLVNNENALKIYKKLGFIKEGNLRQQCFSEGQYFDVQIMSVFNLSFKQEIGKP